ncbi:GNAT family N-acetyltransferase [Albibacterium indicum]|uniref:GNAT family N-acetyltransferase n=1 Tax=Albibacterium indicum TaxID=2292082 RepID=UPI000E51449D|nr:GNAT family N-acetyltransferase [Pedobacter indicus]
MDIRKAESSDIKDIMTIVKKVVPLMRASGNYQWSDDYPNPEVFQEDIDKDQLWVGIMDSKVVSVIAITNEQSPEYNDVGWDLNEDALVTHRLAVDPDLQGAGLARTMMNYAEKLAKERGIHVLRVDTNSENKATQALFPKLGYEYSGIISLRKNPDLRYFCYEKRI